MHEVKAIIIDDEADARHTLQTMIKDYCPEVEIVGLADSLPSGIKLIYKERPSLVFLDIEMPEYNGLEILNFIEPELIQFDIIFTTAYSEYAVQAFKLSAIDYLLKPIQISQLQEAVAKVSTVSAPESIRFRYDALRHNLSAKGEVVRVGLPVADGIRFVQSDQVIFIKAEGSYSVFHMKDGTSITVSKNLKEFQHLSMRSTFFRCHRSYLVNTTMIKQLVKRDGGYLVMENDEQIPISADRREELITLLES